MIDTTRAAQAAIDRAVKGEDISDVLDSFKSATGEFLRQATPTPINDFCWSQLAWPLISANVAPILFAYIYRLTGHKPPFALAIAWLCVFVTLEGTLLLTSAETLVAGFKTWVVKRNDTSKSLRKIAIEHADRANPENAALVAKQILAWIAFFKKVTFTPPILAAGLLGFSEAFGVKISLYEPARTLIVRNWETSILIGLCISVIGWVGWSLNRRYLNMIEIAAERTLRQPK